MSQPIAKNAQTFVAKLRVLVGYLGEKEQHSWWSSSFFSTASEAFLAPIFPRTTFLARCNGVKETATRIHDERIGEGRVHHLFRLPEHIEQKLHAAYLEEETINGLKELTETAETALEALAALGGDAADTSEGPVQIGDADHLLSEAGWCKATAHYHRAFAEGYQTYPYFTESR